MRRGGAQAARQFGGNRRAGQRGAAAVDDDAFVAVAEFKGEGRGAARLGHAGDGGRRGVGEDDDLVSHTPLIAPTARLFERAGAHAPGLYDRLDGRGRGRAAARAAAQPPVAGGEAETAGAAPDGDRVSEY